MNSFQLAFDFNLRPYIVVNRNQPSVRGETPDHDIQFAPTEFVEEEDYVESHGKRINKPFVEKPADAENHNINIFYPHTVGGRAWPSLAPPHLNLYPYTPDPISVYA